MSTVPGRPAGRRRRYLLVVAVAVVAVLGGGAFLVVRSIPEYRTALLVDTSVDPAGGDFAEIAAAVGAAAQNSADDDALSLRRFGGRCADAGNTAQVVEVGTGRASEIAGAVRGLTPDGQPTLLAGILAAIDDFADPYPFRGSKGNRIVVVSRHGVDGCDPDPAKVAAAIRDRVGEAGLDLDFRFVGYQVPAEQRPVLTQVASATGAPEPTFPETADDLTAVLKQFTIPRSPDAAPVAIPTPDPTADWKPYRNTGGGYALRYPPNWSTQECETDLWLAHVPELLPGCLGTDFFFFLAWVRVQEPDQAFSGPYDEETFDDIEVRDVTVDGVAGKRHSAVWAKEDIIGRAAVGTAVVRYVVPANGRVYTISYENDPDSAGAADLLEKFDLMVTKTFSFS
ncbi:hypothetical protein O7626_25135 [Micromonospora sp. WMMD1102]|uniref:hypothetical protein n=1 Tax=Micromonospora sp. WMMD1102 TaxID=3016105 RepID=UPI0024157357|nr:hypothetical protein [Micromonospora sp. WMMD1102]MDG4789176.1 hypothetical protein [Micromonospora sp. WMMD1102]